MTLRGHLGSRNASDQNIRFAVGVVVVVAAVQNGSSPATEHVLLSRQ
jgi:hypothetical protein